MTIYCIIDPYNEPVHGSVAGTPGDAWRRCIDTDVEFGYLPETFREDQAHLEAKGYRLGRGECRFERVQ